MLTRVAACMFLTFFMLNISAQRVDSVQIISGIEIKADRISVFSVGLKVEKIDSITLGIRQGTSLAALLAEQSTVSLRSYGPGGIAMLSMRGTNSSQSGIFWNGINLGQPNMGQTDLSRITTFDFGDISLQSGGASALLGSGVIGGSLHLSNSMDFSSPLKSSVILNGSTSGKLSGGFKLGAGSNRLAYVGSLSGSWSENNYWYSAFNGERKQLEHALTKSISSVHQSEYILNARQRLIAGFWYQSTNRLIPPTMTMSKSDQQLWDQAIRSSLQWSYIVAKQSFIIRTGFIDEKEKFESPVALIEDSYHLNTLLTEFEYKRLFGKQFTLGSGATSHLIRADIPFYNGIEYQPEGSVWLALAVNRSKTGIKGVLNLRQDFSKGYTIPFCPSLSAEVPIIKDVMISFGISRNFRVPTLNDKYGNTDLNPENSYNMEMGASLHIPKGKFFESNISISIYNLLIDNLIQWVPVNASIWKPQNVQKVWSRGVEVSSKTDWEMFGLKGNFKFAYAYSPSTYSETSEKEQNLLNNQLIYIPIHKVIEVFYVTKGSYYAMFSYSMTGKRYVQVDNTKELPVYALLDISAGTTVKAKKMKFKVQAEVANVLGTVYQSILYYPEPGTSFSVNLIISKL